MKIIESQLKPIKFKDIEIGTVFKCDVSPDSFYIKTQQIGITPVMDIIDEDDKVYSFVTTFPPITGSSPIINAINLSTGKGCDVDNDIIVNPYNYEFVIRKKKEN